MRLGTLLMITALAGFLVGVRAIGGTLPAFEAPQTAGIHEADPIRGGFWRPAGSDAVRPIVRLEARTWEPTR